IAEINIKIYYSKFNLQTITAALNGCIIDIIPEFIIIKINKLFKFLLDFLLNKILIFKSVTGLSLFKSDIIL
ncbi:hypothetical protein ASPFODRAFT_147732, partial [Aspergillus luchuensis CBS 106.47]